MPASRGARKRRQAPCMSRRRDFGEGSGDPFCSLLAFGWSRTIDAPLREEGMLRERPCCGRGNRRRALEYVIQRSRAVRGLRRGGADGRPPARHISCIRSARLYCQCDHAPSPCRASPSPSSASARSGATTTAGWPTRPLEDYALRFAPRSFRKWSAFRVGNTAFGAVAFLALEASLVPPSRPAMASPTRCGPSGWSALSSS